MQQIYTVVLRKKSLKNQDSVFVDPHGLIPSFLIICIIEEDGIVLEDAYAHTLL
jgi:hypothetical protein